MNQRDKKLKLITEIIEFIETQPYDAGNCARYVYVKSLDAMACSGLISSDRSIGRQSGIDEEKR